MNWTKPKYQPTIFTRARNIFLLALFTSSGISTSVKAQSVNSVPSTNRILSLVPPTTVRFVPPPPPPPNQVITSGRQQGGASRGDCPAVNKPLTALVPAQWKNLNKRGEDSALTAWQSVWGLTAMPSPELTFYVPYALTPKSPLKFILQDNRGNEIYQKTWTAQKQPSIVGFSLPSTVTLKVGNMYHWYLVVDCDPDAYPLVEGWIQKVAINPTLKNHLSKASPRQRAALYASSGLWYDALSTLAQLRRVAPSDPILFKDWVSLLRSAGLEQFAHEPLTAKLKPISH